jgi:hypothetical protein
MKTIPLFKKTTKIYPELSYGDECVYLGTYKRCDCYIMVYDDAPQSSIVFIRHGKKDEDVYHQHMEECSPSFLMHKNDYKFYIIVKKIIELMSNEMLVYTTVDLNNVRNYPNVTRDGLVATIEI